MIALFDLKTKSTRPQAASHGLAGEGEWQQFSSVQCASKRDTEWTCGAFCADVDSAIYFWNTAIYTLRIKTFWSIQSIKKRSIYYSSRVRAKFWPNFVNFRIDAKNKWRPSETKDCFVHFRRDCEIVFKNSK